MSYSFQRLKEHIYPLSACTPEWFQAVNLAGKGQRGVEIAVQRLSYT